MVYVSENHPNEAATRTIIEIDDDLMAKAIKLAGVNTKKAAVEEGLRLLVQTRLQGRLRKLHGKLHWEGSLDKNAARRVIVVDLILTEVLQGFRNDRDSRRAPIALRMLIFEPMVGRDIALASARKFRVLRARGITVRKTIDLFIATFCMENGHHLLHSDRDFDPIREHLGLKTVVGATHASPEPDRDSPAIVWDARVQP